MISIGSPFVLGIATFGALATCALHFLSVRRPPSLVLPTMRFLPDRPVRAVSRSARPSDLWLLLLRVCALLLAGIAMAGVSWNSSAVMRGRVVVIDRSGIAGDSDMLRERAAEVLRLRSAAGTSAVTPGTRKFAATRIVLVDSVARGMSLAAMGAFKPETLSTVATGSHLSSALLAAIRAATLMIRDEGTIDSVELNIVSPFTHGADDAALRAIRAAWPGRIELTEIANESSTADSGLKAPTIQFIGSTNAAVLSALAPGLSTGGKPSGAGATSAPASTSTVAIEWPSSGIPNGWTQSKPDTVGAIVARGSALVWPFVRTATVPDSLAKRSRAIAWWSDGAVAAIEIENGESCTRQIAASVPGASDALQGQSARALVSALTSACGSSLHTLPLSAAMRSMLAGTGGAAPASAFTSEGAQHTPFGSVLLLLALLLLSAEWWIRDRDRAVQRRSTGEDSPLRKVA